MYPTLHAWTPVRVSSNTPTSAFRRITIGDVPVDLADRAQALDTISERSRRSSATPLGVVSINLDHIHHFGTGARWTSTFGDGERHGIEWLNLIDGAPLARQAHRITGLEWPRLAGSDLAGPILDNAARDGVRVGFLGGSPETHRLLAEKFAKERPNLKISGFWAPSKEELEDPIREYAITMAIAAAQTDILVVCLGKPRQEAWIANHGTDSGAKVLLAFGAVVDFLAGRVSRAPEWVGKVGFEWAWRLALEPRRLANRYLVQGPPAYLAMRRHSGGASPVAVQPPSTTLTYSTSR